MTRDFPSLTRLALVLVLLAPQVARGFGDPSPVVYPPSPAPLHFSHAKHLQLKLACDFCHDRAAASTSSADDLAPTEDACRTCHAIDRAQPAKQSTPPARCDACHVLAAGHSPTEIAAHTTPAPHLKFNHKLHADRRIPCLRCHAQVAGAERVSDERLPLMASCLECHTSTATPATSSTRAPARCVTCHPAQTDGTLETRFAEGSLIPSGTFRGDAHTLQFATEHAPIARTNAQYCAACHRQEFCLGCHASTVKPLAIHGNDYVSIHAVDARKATLQCSACHRAQTFCLGCHERLGVTDAATADSPNSITHAGKRFHPPYQLWVAAPRTPEHHAWEAERNLRSCLSCHREDTCLECHSARPSSTVGGGGQPFNASPHPPAFAASGTCRALQSRNPRVCLKCHGPTDAHLSCQ